MGCARQRRVPCFLLGTGKDGRHRAQPDHAFARRKLRIMPLAAISLTGGVVWHAVGYVGSIIIRMAGRRFIIYGAMAGAVIFLIFMRILAEIIVVSSLLVRYWAIGDRNL